jgi:histidinol-phosphate aminotransferase
MKQNLNKAMSERDSAEMRVPAPSYVRAMLPYQPGKPITEVARELGLAEAGIVKLASNENPLGASALAVEAAQAALAEVARYPDGGGFMLRQALADHHHISPEMLVLGNGSNDVLELASIAFLEPGSSAVYSQHCFIVNRLATQARGAEGIEVPASGYGHDLWAMREAVRSDTRVIFVSNPNNPTGTFVAPGEVRHFLQQVPANVLVVLDEAYYEYLAPEQRSGSVEWISEFPNLLVTRTFSKAYGLAGLRIGYGVAHPDVADLVNRMRQPFNVSNVAQAAALAALGDDAFIERSVELNRAGMAQLTRGLASLGLESIASSGNFVSVRVGDAGRVFKQLLERGVIVRPVAGYGLPEHLRVSIGLESENSRFLEMLAAVL